MTTVWARGRGVAWRRVSGGAVLLPPAAAEPILVTGPGAVVWELLATPSDLPALAESISTEYGVNVDQVGSDLTPFLEALADCAVVTRSGDDR